MQQIGYIILDGKRYRVLFHTVNRYGLAYKNGGITTSSALRHEVDFEEYLNRPESAADRLRFLRGEVIKA